MALAAAADGDVTSSDAKQVVEETLWAMRNAGRVSIFNHVLRELCKAGFLKKEASSYSLTKLGRMTKPIMVSISVATHLKIESFANAKRKLAPTVAEWGLRRTFAPFRQRNSA